MPIVHRKESEFYQLAVWHSIEPEAELKNGIVLTPEEQIALSAASSSTRRREILTVRRLLNEVSSGKRTLAYATNGKPVLDDGSHISISHSKDMVAMILSKRFPVGIDIEAQRPQIRKLSVKFVSETEQLRWGNGLTDEALHLIWGAKEVLYKLYSKGGLDFKTDLSIVPPQGDTIRTVKAHFHNSSERFDVDVHFEPIAGFMMSWAIRNEDVPR